MGQRSTVMFTTGPAGSGKSFCRCARFLLTEYLPNNEGTHISNFPVQFDPWVDGAGQGRTGLIALAGDMLGMDEETVRRRVERIPDEVTNGWRNEHLVKGNNNQPVHGPWEYFHERDLSGCHLAIDEIHNFCGVHSPPRVKREWQKWLGELRHRGATIEFLSQHEAKVAKEIQLEAEVRLVLIPQEQRPDPVFGIKLYYWYNLFAKATGIWRPSVWVYEQRQVAGKWEVEGRDRWYYDGKLFGAYDSWSAPIAGGTAGTTGKKEYQTKSWPALLLWFFWVNPGPLVTRSIILALLVSAWVFRAKLTKLYFASFLMIQPGGQSPPAGQGSGAGAQPVAFTSAGPVTFEGKEVVPEVVPVMVARLDEAEDELVSVRAEAANAQERLAAIEERLQTAFAVTGLTRDEVFFRAGCSYRVGEVIEFGPYDGAKVERIDYARRLVHLSSGSVLRMGLGDARVTPADWLQNLGASETNPSAGATDVPRPLPSSGGTPTPAKPVGRPAEAGKPILARDAIGGIRTADGRPASVLNRHGTEPRPAAGHGGTGGRATR